MKKLIFLLILASNSWAGMAPDDPRWQLVEAFKTRKIAEQKAFQVQLEEAKLSKKVLAQKEAEILKPDLRDDGVPFSVYKFIESQVKDPSSIQILSVSDLEWDDSMKMWHVTVKFTSNNSYGAKSSSALAGCYVQRYGENYMHVIW